MGTRAAESCSATVPLAAMAASHALSAAKRPRAPGPHTVTAAVAPPGQVTAATWRSTRASWPGTEGTTHLRPGWRRASSAAACLKKNKNKTPQPTVIRARPQDTQRCEGRRCGPGTCAAFVPCLRFLPPIRPFRQSSRGGWTGPHLAEEGQVAVHLLGPAAGENAQKWSPGGGGKAEAGAGVAAAAREPHACGERRCHDELCTIHNPQTTLPPVASPTAQHSPLPPSPRPRSIPRR
eukprot:5332606-Pyramimonas_sp.AAC.1